MKNIIQIFRTLGKAQCLICKRRSSIVLELGHVENRVGSVITIDICESCKKKLLDKLSQENV